MAREAMCQLLQELHASNSCSVWHLQLRKWYNCWEQVTARPLDKCHIASEFGSELIRGFWSASEVECSSA
jgi:hypothetical protein